MHLHSLGFRKTAAMKDFRAILPEAVACEVKEAAALSRGSVMSRAGHDVTDTEMDDIIKLCNQAISLSQFRDELRELIEKRCALCWR